MRRFLFAATALASAGCATGASATGLQTNRFMGDISSAHVGSQTVSQALAGAGGGTSMIGLANGAASLDATKHVPAAQIPFGSTTGTVADGGALATAAAAANAAVPSSAIGAASGVASLNGSKQLPSAQIPFGTTSGTVADGGALASAAAAANAAVPSSAIGAASGVASLNGSKQLPAAQIPFGTTTGTVADGGVLQNFMQSAATTFLGVAGNASNTLVKALSDSAGRTLASWAGDVYNLADHGADGTAANDNAALNKGITYATARGAAGGYTVIYTPQNIGGSPWQFTSAPTSGGSGVFGFGFPSNTEFAGAGDNATTIAWNDKNSGYYLFGSAYDVGATSGRVSNLMFRDFRIVGTWSLTDYASGDGAILPDNVDGLTFRNVESDYSRGFGLGAAYSTNVIFDHDIINVSYADGISARASAQLMLTNLRISHTNDDCLSAHQEQGAPEGVRRDILIGNVQCFDTQAINIAAPLHLSINNVLMSSPKGAALSIGSQGVGGSGEGSAAPAGIAISNFWILNPIARSAVDTYNQGDVAIALDFAPARTGNTPPPAGQSGYTTPNSVPGWGSAGQGFIRNPYPEWMTNNNLASSALNGAAQINFDNVGVIRTMPGADGVLGDGSDSRFPNFGSFLQGEPQGAYAAVTATPKESDLRVQCMNIIGGNIHSLYIHNLTCAGMNTGLTVSDGGSLAQQDDIVLDGGHFFDLTGYGVGIADYAAGSSLQMIVRNSDFDMDPFPADPAYKGYRQPGPQNTIGISSLSWANGVVTVVTSSAPSPAYLTGQMAHIYFVSPGGYTGYFPLTAVNSTTFTYKLATNPGAVTSTSGMTVSVPTPPPFAAGTVFGGWNSVDNTYCGYVALCQKSNNGTALPVLGGVLAFNNTIKNAATDTNVDTTSTTSGWTFRNNYDYAQITVPNAYSSSNLGIGQTHPGFEVIPIDANPNDAAYGQPLAVKPAAAPTYPTSGLWSPGDFVRNSAPTASASTQGWLRVTQTNTAGTNGAPNNYVLGTDWIAK